METNKIVNESLGEYVYSINEAFASNALREFDKYVKQHVSSRFKHDITDYLKRGLYYNSKKALHPHELTDENSFMLYDNKDVFDLVKQLMDSGKHVGVVEASENQGVIPYLGGEFIHLYPSMNNMDDEIAYLVFFKVSDTRDLDTNKPKKSDKYHWGAKPNNILGNPREKEFNDRRKYNLLDEKGKNEIDGLIKKYGFKTIKDHFSSVYPKEFR